MNKQAAHLMPRAEQPQQLRRPDLPANRQGNPKWVKGGPSPNPKGRRLEAYRLADLAKAHTPEAVATLAEIMNDRKRPGQTRVNAATALMDRAFGRPSIVVEAKVKAADTG